MMTYYADHALLPDGWATRVRLDVDAGGSISAVLANADAAGAERLSGPLLPGMPNLHSHAFQRAMAGLGEVRGSPDDDFWNWRELMYKFAGRITPQQSMAVARHLYIEMLKSGYTAVAEFHYVHNDPTGQPYANPAEMSLAHVAAASEAGIAITMLPVLYSNGNFGAAPLGPRQQRFRTGPEDILATVRAVRKAAAGHADLNCGVAPHSLRAAGLTGCVTSSPGSKRSTPRPRSTSTSRSRRARLTTASRSAANARWSGCSSTCPSITVGASCMRRT